MAAAVEHICSKGCVDVRKDIAVLELGQVPPGVAGLTLDERQILLSELKSIMEVYGDTCRLPEDEA